MYQMKEQDKTPEKLLNEVEIGNQREILELKSTITEMKNTLEGFKEDLIRQKKE